MVERVKQVKRFKMRDGRTGKKRLKSWVEIQSKKKSSSANISQSQQYSMDNEADISQVQLEIPLSIGPPISDHSQTHGSQFSFVRLLLEPLDHPIQVLEVPNLCGDITNLDSQKN